MIGSYTIDSLSKPRYPHIISLEKLQTYRIVFATLCFISFLISTLRVGYFHQFFYITTICNNLTWITLLLSFYVSKDTYRCETASNKNPLNCRSLEQLTMILIEFNLNMEAIASIIYWIGFFLKLTPDYSHEGIKRYNSYLIHTLPIFGMIFNVVYTNLRFSYTHWKFTFWVTMALLIQNCIYVRTTGIQLYPLLKWDGFGTVVVASITLGVVTGLYMLSVYLVNKLQYQEDLNSKSLSQCKKS